MRINDLKRFVDRTVTLRMTDGETAKVKVDFVDEEYEDIIAAVLEISRPERYRAPCAVHIFPAGDNRICRTVGVNAHNAERTLTAHSLDHKPDRLLAARMWLMSRSGNSEAGNY